MVVAGKDEGLASRRSRGQRHCRPGGQGTGRRRGSPRGDHPAHARCSRRHPGHRRFLLGSLRRCGTVLSAQDVDRAADAGANFLVSPGLSEEIVAQALERQVPLIPGVATATEIQAAQGLGFTHLKFFPAGPSGGPEALRALKGPFPGVRFIPTGGVTRENAPHYLKTGNVLAVGGTWIVPGESVRRSDFGNIEKLAGQAREHVGVHCDWSPP